MERLQFESRRQNIVTHDGAENLLRKRATKRAISAIEGKIRLIAAEVPIMYGFTTPARPSNP